MPTVIDSLVTEVTLDPKGYTEGRKQLDEDQKKVRSEAVRTGKELEARGGQASQFFGKIRNQAIALFATITGTKALASLTSDVVSSAAAVGRMSKQLNISTEDLSAWQNVAERTGGSAAGITGALSGLTDAFQQIKTFGTAGEKDAILRNLGIVPEDLDDAQGALLKIADSLSKMDPRRARLLAGGLGIDEGTINVLLKGRAALEGYIAEQRKLGVTTEAEAARAQEAEAQLAKARQAWRDLAQTLLIEVAPAFEKLTGWLTRAAGQLRDVKDGVDGFANQPAVKTTLELGDAVGGLGTRLGELLGIFNKFGSGEGGPTILQRAMVTLDHYIQAVSHSIKSLTAALRGDLKTAGAEFKQSADQMALARSPELQAALAGRTRPGAPAATTPAGAPRAAVPGARDPTAVGYNRDMAIRTLIGEARRGDTTGQGDVAHVILNRQARTGRSAGDVVTQKGQFEPWMTERRKRELMAIKTDSPEYLAAQAAWTKAVQEKAAGVDPTGGATMFVSPEGQRAMGRKMPTWADPNKRTLERGGHQFYTGAFPGDRGERWSAQQARAKSQAAQPQTVTNTVTVGAVHINTQATDARGIAREIGPAIRTQGNLATQANSGAQ